MSWDEGTLKYGPIPLWHQIAERLRRAIASGEFGPGEALPSEAEINARFGVSRTTARTSLDRLKEDGLIMQPLDRLSSFSDDMRARGLTPSYLTESIRRCPLTRRAAQALNLEPRSEALRIKRQLLADEFQIGLSDSWISPAIMGNNSPPDRAALDNGSLYDWLRDICGAVIAGGHEVIEATAANRYQANSLDVAPGSPLLLAHRTCHTHDGSPIEHATMHYRPDRYRFRVDLVHH